MDISSKIQYNENYNTHKFGGLTKNEQSFKECESPMTDYQFKSIMKMILALLKTSSNLQEAITTLQNCTAEDDETNI